MSEFSRFGGGLSEKACFQQLATASPAVRTQCYADRLMEWHFWVNKLWAFWEGILLLALGLFGLIREYFRLRTGTEPAPAWRMRRILVGIALCVMGIAFLVASHWATQ